MEWCAISASARSSQRSRPVIRQCFLLKLFCSIWGKQKSKYITDKKDKMPLIQTEICSLKFV